MVWAPVYNDSLGNCMADTVAIAGTFLAKIKHVHATDLPLLRQGVC